MVMVRLYKRADGEWVQGDNPFYPSCRNPYICGDPDFDLIDDLARQIDISGSISASKI